MKNSITLNIGDLVKWIGFPGANVPPELTGPVGPGIIIAVISISKEKRFDVLWSDVTIGRHLYLQTLQKGIIA